MRHLFEFFYMDILTGKKKWEQTNQSESKNKISDPEA